MQDKTPEEIIEFNKSCGRFMGYDYSDCCYDPDWAGYSETGLTAIRFLPYSDANDREMLVPSCDRLDDYKPYTLDNIQLITWQENKDKSHADRRNGVNNKDSKAVIQMDKLGNFISRFHSIKYAARTTGTHYAGIHHCLAKRYRSSGGYCWMYELSSGFFIKA